MQIHASCAARHGAGVLLLGPSGCGKSDLLLRLLDGGFELVADDRVEIDAGQARAPATLAGLLEVRGFGIVRLPYRAAATLLLAVELVSAGDGAPRLPLPRRHPALDLPLVAVDPDRVSAARRVGMALDCALGRVTQLAGAFA